VTIDVLKNKRKLYPKQSFELWSMKKRECWKEVINIGLSKGDVNGDRISHWAESFEVCDELCVSVCMTHFNITFRLWSSGL
jgi:hypothetical protein